MMAIALLFGVFALLVGVAVLAAWNTPRDIAESGGQVC